MGDVSTWSQGQVIIAVILCGVAIGVSAIVALGILNIFDYLRNR